MRRRFMAFMQGRYGCDELYKFLSYAVIVLIIINLFLRSAILSLLILFVFGYSIFRVLSKNIVRRNLERVKYIKYRTKLLTWYSNQKMMFSQRKTHRFFKCPNCRATVRVPKGKGKIKITCPKCSTAFIKNT